MNVNGNKPLYLQVEADIKNDIVSKKYSPGQKIPTENELTQLYGVSKITIRKAMQKLTDEGVIQKVQGKGTFISYKKEKLFLNKTKGFKESLLDHGHSTKHNILQVSFLSGNEEITEKLKIPLHAKIVYLERLIWEDDDPIAIDKIYIDEAKFPGFVSKIAEDKSFYQILKDTYNIEPTSSIMEISGMLANNHVADLLRCNIGDPLFYIEKISNKEEIPIHYSITTVRCDRISYVVTTNNHTIMNEKLKEC